MTNKPPFFHVIVWIYPASRIARLILSDLDEKELKERFIRPYEKGERILANSENVDLMQVSSVEIIRTDAPKEVILAELEEEHFARMNRNQSQGAIIVGLPPGEEDISEKGENVTARYITTPPGARKSAGLINAVLNHPVVSGVLATVIAALFLAYFFGIGD